MQKSDQKRDRDSRIVRDSHNRVLSRNDSLKPNEADVMKTPLKICVAGARDLP
jgi:hypothetical protein